MKFCKKKGIFIFVLVFFSVLSVWGSGKRDRLFDTVENGTEKEIKAALRKDPDYANVKRGKEKETLLMSALKEDRELSVINILLKYGADPMEKDAQKRNSLMYAAKFSSSPEVLERLVKVNSIFNFSRKNKILKKDRNGKTTLDYAEENPSPEKMLAVLRKYVKEKEEKQSPKPEEELSREQIEQIQSETPEESISQEAGKDDSPEEQMKVPAENPDAQQEADSGEQAAEEEGIPAIPLPSEAEEQDKQEITTEIPASSISTEKQDEKKISESQEDFSEPVSSEESSLEQNESELKIHTYTKTSLFDYAEEKQEVQEPQKSRSLPPLVKNPDERDEKGRTKLMKVCMEGKIEPAEELIKSNADVNARDADGWTALMFASRFSDNEELVKLLLKNGADPKAKNNYGVSSLKLTATFSKNPKILRKLLSCYETADSEVRSSFISAITSENSVSIIEEFLKTGIPVNAFYEGKTPLMYAAEYCRDTKLIGCLLDNGAKINYRTDSNLTAFDFARKNKKLKRDSIYWSLKASGEKR